MKTRTNLKAAATIRVHYDTGYGNRIAISGSAGPS
jgi:hypothetical protein